MKGGDHVEVTRSLTVAACLRARLVYGGGLLTVAAEVSGSTALRVRQTTARTFVPRGLRMTAKGSEILRCAQDDPLNDCGSLYQLCDLFEFGMLGGF
jgi:hypothetical protein